MKRNIFTIALMGIMMAGCDQFDEVSDAAVIAPIEVSVELEINQSDVNAGDQMNIVLDNYNDGVHVEKTFTGSSCKVDGLIPGVYTVKVSGSAYDGEGSEYILNGNLLNTNLLYDGASIVVSMQGLKVSPLVFSEIYFCGSKPPVGFSYFRDQFYEIYNNSSTVQYLDGLYFANLTPGTATRSLPIWPEEDGTDYCYAERVWRFPGNGAEYPLQPGEAAVLSQFAANHRLEMYNPNSPIDGSSSDFEFYMGNTNFPDQPAVNMEHVFYNGKNEYGLPQYLTSVFGGAYVVFKVPDDESYDPVGDPRLSTTDLSTTRPTLYAKIPIRYVLDAVEAIHNDTYSDAKRVPAVLDGGFTYVGATYIGKGVTRRLALDSDGNPLTRDNGAVIFQDTNNSTDDFERGVDPVMHRHSKMAPWNHTLAR